MLRRLFDLPLRQLRARPLMCFSSAFAVGIIAAKYLPHAAAIAIAVAFALCIAVYGFRLFKHRSLKRMAAMLLLFGVLLGMLRMMGAVKAVPEVETQYSVQMVGRVDGEPFTRETDGRVIFPFRLSSIDGTPSDLRLRLYLRGDEMPGYAIEYGQTLRVTGHIWESDPVTNPYEFDFHEYLLQNDLCAIATAKFKDVVIESKSRDARSLLISIKRAITERIENMFPRSAPMVRALVLGDRSELSEEQRSGLSATGTAHLIAISGLHVTALAFALTQLLGLFMSRRHASIIVLIPLFVYGAMIGFTPSFSRALIMFAVFSFAPVAGLPTDSMTRLSIAMLICLAARPFDISDAGFVMSFSASAGLILLTPPLQALFGLPEMQSRDRLRYADHSLFYEARYWVGDTLCASLAAQLATLPAVVAAFGVQSVVSLPFNLICVPLGVGGYILSMVALLVGAILPPLGRLFAAIPDLLLSALTSITQFSLSLPVTTVRIGRYPAVLCVIHAGLMLASSGLCRIRMSIRKLLPIALLGVAGISTLVCFLSSWSFGVTFLDAEHADSAVVRTRGQTYVIDCGDTYTPIADYLSATCLHVNAVFLSHPHADHSGGLGKLLDEFKPDTIYVPAGFFDAKDVSMTVQNVIAKARGMGITFKELKTGDTVQLSANAKLTAWAPTASGVVEKCDDISLMALVEYEDRSILFTGDLFTVNEPDDVPKCDVLKVAHHGANNATSAQFLEAARPEYAVISVGENSFGHPGEETLARLKACGTKILTTLKCGAITFEPKDDSWRISTYLEASDDME